MISSESDQLSRELNHIERDLKTVEKALNRHDDALLNKERPVLAAEIQEHLSNALDTLQKGTSHLKQIQHQLQGRNIAPTPKRLQRLQKLQTRVDKTQEKVKALRGYANQIGNKVEDIQRQEGLARGQAAAREVNSPEALHQVEQVSIDEMLAASKLLGKQSEGLLVLDTVLYKCTGAEVNNGFTFRDMELLLDAERSLETLPVNLSPATLNSINQLKTVIAEAKTTIEDAFMKRLECLEAIDFSDLEPLGRANFDENSFADKKDAVFAAHDLYWNFHNPCEPSIGLQDFTLMWQQMENNRIPFPHGVDVARFNERINALQTVQANIVAYGNGSKYQELQIEHPTDFHDHKIEYLQAVRTEAILAQAGQPAPKVLIMGAGPGGLLRALAGGLKGADVEVLEKRGGFTRKNMVKLKHQPILNYFGVTDTMVAEGYMHPKRGADINVQIMGLQRALAKSVDDLLGENTVKTGYDLVDIQAAVVGDPENERIVTGGLIRSGDEAVWTQADLIVDATGAGAAAAKILGSKREVLSEDSMMVAAVYKDIPQEPSVEERIPGSQKWNVHLSTPEFNYELILPTDEQQAEITEYQNRIGQLQETRIEIDRLVKKIDNSMDSEGEGNALALVYADTLYRRLTGEELEPNEEINWPVLKGSAKDALQDYSEQIDQIQSLLTSKIREIATNVASGDPNFLGPIESKNIDVANAFRIEISQRKPAVIVGNCLVQQSGDALATPDPMSGTGCNTALKGATIFARSLGALQAGKSTDQQLRDFTFATNKQTRALVEDSFTARTEPSKGIHQKATPAYIFQRAISTGTLSQTDKEVFERLEFKASHKIPFSKTDQKLWQKLRPRIQTVAAAEAAQNVDISKLTTNITQIDQHRRAA